MRHQLNKALTTTTRTLVSLFINRQLLFLVGGATKRRLAVNDSLIQARLGDVPRPPL
jgi:hypothetical protein